jgi:hypothetical protein
VYHTIHSIGMHLSTDVLIGIVVVLGAVQCFFGYRAFKFLLVLVGFVLGYALVYEAVFSLLHHKAAAFFIALAGGVVCGALITGAYLLGVFLVGVIFGSALALHLYTIAAQHPEPAMLFIFAALGGLLALFFQKLSIITATAFGGAWAVVAGIAWYITRAIDPTNLASVEKYFRAGGVPVYAVVACWIVLGVMGVYYQYKVAPIVGAPKGKIRASAPEPEGKKDRDAA